MFTKTTTSRHRTYSAKERHHDLPLCYFSLVVIVEPDTNKWVDHNDNIQEAKWNIWVDHCKKLKAELDSDVCYDHPELIDPYMLNKVIGVMNPGKISSLPPILDNDVDILFSKKRRGFPADLITYIESVIQRYPRLRIALVGGVVEDEIERVASQIRKLGPHPIILLPFCLTDSDFEV